MGAQVIDLSRLLKPENFHPLSHLDVPLPFRSVQFQPGADTQIPTLLNDGNFRAAAILAAHQLTTSTRPDDHERVFYLFYTRLATLCLIGSTHLAAHESKALEDMNSGMYFDQQTGKNIIPWELRLLIIRLQSIGFGDWHRGFTAYYEMRQEAVAELMKAPKIKRDFWNNRLSDLGLRVGNALVEMGAHDTAVRFMEEDLRYDAVGEEGLEGDGAIRMRLSLLFLRIGDMNAARRCFTRRTGDTTGYIEHRIMSALCSMSDADYPAAVREWRRLADSQLNQKGREMIIQNLAVCLLYTGELAEARRLLESLVDGGYSFHGLTFNLSTIYELCTERARDSKQNLAQRVANPAQAVPVWVRSNMDFKL